MTKPKKPKRKPRRLIVADIHIHPTCGCPVCSRVRELKLKIGTHVRLVAEVLK